MVPETFIDTEYNYHVEVYCPKCSSDDVVIEMVDGFFYFSRCHNCGYQIVRRANPTDTINKV